MAYSRTLAELELAVRREADMVNSQFVTSAEVREYINQSWAELYDRIVLFDQEYLLKYVDVESSAASSPGEFDLLNDAKTGIVRSFNVVSTPGTGYLTGAATLQQGTNQSAQVLITASGGLVTGVTITNAGSGYTSNSLTTDVATLTVVQPGGAGALVGVTLDSDFYKCKGVWISGAAGAWDPLRRFQWDQQNALRQTDTYGGIGSLPLYRVYTLNGREKLGIAPIMSGTYRVWYYPAPYKMLTDTDRIDGRSGWDEWVVKDVAIKCLLKEESIEQAASIKAIRDELFQRFQLHASERDASQPEKIRNVNLLSRRYTNWR